jgi:predicted  nucleic acid-binding Zn-ribbon protein
MNMEVYVTKTTTDIAPAGQGVELDGAENLDIVIDASAGIAAEEQEEIIANIDAIAGKNRITSAPVKVTAKKRGILLPVLINISALVVLAGGLFFLWTFFKQTDTVIRTDSGTLNSAEGKLLEEIQNEFDAARAEFDAARAALDKLNSNMERATLFEWQMSGFYNTVNTYFRGGKLMEARNTITLMREFVNTPSFREINQIEERRELNLAMIDTVSRLIDESIRARNVTDELDRASQIASDALREKEGAESRVLALEAELNSVQAASQKTIDTLRSQNTQKDQALAVSQQRTANELKAQAEKFQRNIASNQKTIRDLQSEVKGYKQRIDAVSAAVASVANNPSGAGSLISIDDAFNKLDVAFE